MNVYEMTSKAHNVKTVELSLTTFYKDSTSRFMHETVTVERCEFGLDTFKYRDFAVLYFEVVKRGCLRITATRTI